jgi:hypothetical protein
MKKVPWGTIWGGETFEGMALILKVSVFLSLEFWGCSREKTVFSLINDHVRTKIFRESDILIKKSLILLLQISLWAIKNVPYEADILIMRA